MKTSILPVFLLLLSSCGPISNNTNLKEIDLQPPTLIEFHVADSRNIVLTFNEKPLFVESSLEIEPSLKILEVKIEDKRAFITTNPQETGKRYSLIAEVSDKGGNSLSFMKFFYGYNKDIPSLVINEFVTRGSGKHPDFVELYITSGGNMGGVTVLNGTMGNWKDRLIFPPFNVENGDYLIIHFKPSGSSEEKNETTDKSVSGGYDSSDNAFDFWVKDARGLSGNNGVITVYATPEGKLIDGVLYSNRNSNSDTKYDGFGLADTKARANELADSAGWYFSGEKIAPEDAINPEGSTGTRSICRNGESKDTNRKSDWHIVPTRGSTPGYKNREEIYNF